MRRALFAILSAVLFCMGTPAVKAGEAEIKPVGPGEAMPDFTLSGHDGEEVSISALEGKNILLVFPRGKVADHWCQICHYQYAELADIEKREGIREKYDLEILFVLPYGMEEVREWVDIFPHQMDVIDEWKNPPESKKDNEAYQKWAVTARRLFPREFHFEKGEVPLPFPVLSDGDRAVSKGLDLFRTNWDRSEVEQNVSTIYLIDREGNVSFKYFSQNTMDRPPLDYVVKVLDWMAK